MDRSSDSRCTRCQSTQIQRLFKAYGFDGPRDLTWTLLQCGNCGLVRVDPMPNEEELACYYAQSYYGTTEKKFSAPLEWLVQLGNRLRARTLLKSLDAPHFLPRFLPRFLDVGCGRGGFLRFLSTLGYSGTGTEVPGFDFGKPAPGIEFLHGRIETLPLEPHSFDGASVWHVLEHLRDPTAALKRISDLIKPGGVLAVAVPNFGSFQSRLFGRHWFHLDLPRHLYQITKPVLLSLLRDCGLETIRVHTFSPDQNLYGSLQSALNALLVPFGGKPNALYSLLKASPKGRRLDPSGLLSLLLSPWILPFCILEDLISTPFKRGGTLIVYARKPKQFPS